MRKYFTSRHVLVRTKQGKKKARRDTELLLFLATPCFMAYEEHRTGMAFFCSPLECELLSFVVSSACP